MSLCAIESAARRDDGPFETQQFAEALAFGQ